MKKVIKLTESDLTKIVRRVISESHLSILIEKIVKIEFEGIDGIWYDWSNYNCGMGECCDPYSVSFHLEGSEYFEIFFKLVDGGKYDDDGDYPKELSEELPVECEEYPDINNPRFDTIIVYDEVAEVINKYFDSSDVWKNEFLSFINRMFNLEVKNILVVEWY